MNPTRTVILPGKTPKKKDHKTRGNKRYGAHLECSKAVRPEAREMRPTISRTVCREPR